MSDEKKLFALLSQMVALTLVYFRITRAPISTETIISGELDEKDAEPIRLMSMLGVSTEQLVSVLGSKKFCHFNDFCFDYFDLLDGDLPATYTDGIFYASANELIKRGRAVLLKNSRPKILECIKNMQAQLSSPEIVEKTVDSLERGVVDFRGLAQGEFKSVAQSLLECEEKNLIEKKAVEKSVVCAISALHSIAGSVMMEETFVKDGLLNSPPFNKCDGIRWVFASECLMKASEDLIASEIYHSQEIKDLQRKERAMHGSRGASQNKKRYEPLMKEFVNWYRENRCRFGSDNNAYRYFKIEVYDKLPREAQVLKAEGNHIRTFAEWKRANIP